MKRKKKTSTDNFNIDDYQHHADWKLEEVGIDLCTMLYWLVDCLIVQGLTPEGTEKYIHTVVMGDPQSTIRVRSRPDKPGAVKVTYVVSLDKEPGFTCSITELPMLYGWVKKCRGNTDD